MKQRMLVLGLLLVTVGLRADTGAQPATVGGNDLPQLFLNGDGLLGERTEPVGQMGQEISGFGVGLEYAPSYFLHHLGLNADYGYLDESKTASARDNTFDLSLRLFSPHCGPVFFWLQAGAGYNITPNTVNGRFLAFAGPGLRWFVAPRLAFDVGVQYMSQTPQKAFVQSFSGTVGLSIPFDASFISGRAKAVTVEEQPVSESAPVAAPWPTPATTPASTPVATPSPIAASAPAFSRLYIYRVRKGEDLWTIAGKTIGDPALWPLLVTSKGASIADPDSIYIGEKLRYRGAYTVREIEKAVKKAAVYPTPSKDMPVP